MAFIYPVNYLFCKYMSLFCNNVSMAVSIFPQGHVMCVICVGVMWCFVFSLSFSLTASTPGVVCGQCLFPRVDGHFQTGPLGFQLPRPQSEFALYWPNAWGHSLPYAPQPRFRSSCYYGQSNLILQDLLMLSNWTHIMGLSQDIPFWNLL